MTKGSHFLNQFLLFAAPSMAALLIVFGIFFGMEQSENITSIKHTDATIITLAKTTLNNHFIGTGDDLIFLSELNNIKSDSNSNRLNSVATTRALLDFLASKHQYRYVSILNEQGLPLIQMNRDKDAISVTANPTNTIADIETLMQLGIGEIYTSPMTLRSDINGILLPKQPTVNFVTPLFDDNGQRKGYLEIGLDAQNIINDYRSIAGRVGNHLYLLNSDGYWLMNPQTNKEFGFFSKDGARFSTEMPDAWQSISLSPEGQFRDDHGLFTYSTMKPTQTVTHAVNEYQWVLLAVTTNDRIKVGLTAIAKSLLNVFLALTAVLVVICWQLAASRIQRIKTRQTLSESEQLNRSIVQTSAHAIIAMDDHGLILSCNLSALKLFNRTEDDAKGFKFERTFISSLQQSRFLDLLHKALELQTGSHTAPETFEAFDIQGYTIPVTIALSVDQWHGRKIVTAFITDNREHLKTVELQRLTEVVFRATTEGIAVTDTNNNIAAINPGFTAITGYSAEDVLTKNPRILRSGRHDTAFYQDMWAILIEKGFWRGEIWNRKKSGEIYPEEISLALVRNDDGEIIHHVAIFHDITSRKSQEQRISHQAHYDQLTELPNRYVFIDHLDREIQNFKRYGVSFALLFIDLNQFKDINDTFGHRTGDQVLQEAAKRLQDSVRESDMVARLAGDEFTVVVRAIQSAQDLSRLIAKVKAGLDGPLLVGDDQVMLSGAIGGVIYTTQLGSADDLLNAADEAMYESKKHDEMHGISHDKPD